ASGGAARRLQLASSRWAFRDLRIDRDHATWRRRFPLPRYFELKVHVERCKTPRPRGVRAQLPTARRKGMLTLVDVSAEGNFHVFTWRTMQPSSRAFDKVVEATDALDTAPLGSIVHATVTPPFNPGLRCASIS